MSITAAERNSADAYAGPGKKEPLYSSGAHLRAAWDLAGRVKGGNGDAIRAKIRAFARRHGLTRLLPKTALATKAMTDTMSDESAPVGSRTAGLVQLAYQHASAADGEYGSYHRQHVIEHAQTHGIARHLPSEAHGFMHAHGMAHDHGDGEAQHVHPIMKALPPVGETGGDQGGLSPDLPGRRVAAMLDAAFDLCMDDPDAGKPDSQYACLVKFVDDHNLRRFVTRDFELVQPSGSAPDSQDEPGTPSPGASETPAGPSSQLATEGPSEGNPPGDVTPGEIHDPLPTPAGAQSQLPEGEMSSTLVGKALTEIPLRKPGLLVSKAWAGSDGTCVIEGWVSTDQEDLEHDIVPPEAFLPSIGNYAARRMPLSVEHGYSKGGGLLSSLPIGHGQKVALVRDGVVLKAEKHPTDPADFEAFPGTGTGVYGRFIITEPQHAGMVRKGNIGGFSWVGNLTEYEPRSGRGRTFKTIDPWLESTIAAYPVNDTALVVTAKAQSKED